MAKQRRLYRVAERIQALLATTLPRLSDPRLGLVTITSVVPAKDLTHAKVYWTVMGDEKRRDEVKEGLQAASGMFRSVVARDLGLRMSPSLRFYYDNTYDVQEQVAHLLGRMSGSAAADELVDVQEEDDDGDEADAELTSDIEGEENGVSHSGSE